MTTLSIPQRRDPIARVGLFAIISTVVWIFVASLATPAPIAAQSDIILIATPVPTEALPTPADPALALVAPTAAPAWVDQALGQVGTAADQFADDQAALLAQEQAAAEQVARDQYLANVGAQAAHSPRGDVSAPPPSQTGPIQYPAAEGQPAYVVAPAVPTDIPLTVPAIAVAVPHISAEQAAVIGARQSNGCAPGEVFYPRTGCHALGSGGPQPGAVGAP